MTAVGINNEGYREILAVEERSAGYLRDDHQGLVNATERYFQGCQWHRCQVHYLRNLLNLVPRKFSKVLADQVKDIFNAPDREQAQVRVNQLIALYENKLPKLAEFLENTAHEVLACFNFPKEHRKRIRTTNGLERFHEEIRRRTRVIRIFPNQKSCLRLVSALAAEQHDSWASGEKYLRMEPLYELNNISQDQELIQPIPLKPILQNI